jgi:flagellin-like protein
VEKYQSSLKMRNINNNSRGISNVIGALMLTLIVVGAATSFALFVSQRQEMQQKAEFAKVQRELENIDILNIEPNYNTTSELEKLNFSIVNVNKDSVRVTGIWVNKYPYYNKNENITIIRGNGCKQNWSFDDTNQLIGLSQNCDNGDWIELADIYNRPVRLDMDSYETITFSFDDITNQITFFEALQNEPLIIKIYTSRGNIFEKTFYPPSAIIKIITESLPGGTSHYILDGSASDHPGDGYIIKWEWDVSDVTNSPSIYADPEPYGRKTQITDASFSFGEVGHKYRVDLTVTDNYGMKGNTSFYYDLT